MLESEITEELLQRIRNLPSVYDVLKGLDIVESPISRAETVWLLQEMFEKIFIPKDTTSDRTAMTQDTLASMTSEIEEIRRLLPWKHWKKYSPSEQISLPAIREEIVDLFHFFVNLCIIWEISWDSLYRNYLIKRETNRKRLRNQFLGEGM